MGNNSIRKKRRVWPYVVLTIIIILGGTGYYLYYRFIAEDRWKPILQQQLKALILRSSDSLYHIDYSDFDLNVSSGNAVLKDFKLEPDTIVYKKLVAKHKAPDNLFILSVKKLSIKNIGARKAYKEKILNINNVAIEAPKLTIINKRYSFNDTVTVGKSKTPYQVIKNIFMQLRIDSISLKNISLNYINRNEKQEKHTSLKHLDIFVSDIFIDSLSEKDPKRFYYTKDINIKIHNYEVKTPDSIYTAKIKQIYFSTRQRKIVLDKVELLPKYSKKEFYLNVEKPGDRFHLQFKRIALEEIDLQRFLREQKLFAETMNVTNSIVSIYSNNAYKKKKKVSFVGKDPHQALQKVALDMKINRLNIYNTDVTYSETEKKTGKTGIISFTNTNGYFTNVTNNDEAKRADPFMRVHLNTTFMKAAKFNVNFKFNQAAKNGAFNYSGTLGKFDGRILDKLVKPLALVHVESADIQKLYFNINANNYGAKGKVNFYYDNLKIQLLAKEEGKAELQKQGFISSVANTMIIKNNNPDSFGNLTPGPVDMNRTPDMPFFSLLYKALLDGLKPSVGYDKKKEQSVNSTIKGVGMFIDTYNIIFKSKSEKNKKSKKDTKDAKAKQQPKE